MADGNRRARGDAAGAGATGLGVRRRLMRGVTWSVAGLLLLTAAGLGLVYVKLDGNIAGIDINGILGTDRPEDTPGDSMDILVLGSDSRSGENSQYGKDLGKARSDTAMIVHIYENRKRAAIVSVPRDTLVNRPSCERTEGGVAQASYRAIFNAAYTIGGPACSVKTVEFMTGIRMDHFIEVDFSGFKKLVDRLGGVKVTTSRAIKDEDSRLDLPPGNHTLDGEQALGLVRTRKSLGDGSDLGRIEVQQAFVKALVNQVREVGVFNNPKRLYDLADTSTSSVTTDSELASAGKLLGFGRSLQNIESRNIQMVTLPVDYDLGSPSRVVPRQAQAQQIWRALRRDESIPKAALKDSASEETGIGRLVE